jgi:dockerin type I repeat protein
MSSRANLFAFMVVLLVCLSGFIAGGGSVYAQAQSADSTTVVEDNKRGDINLDGSLDIMDLLSILGKITGQAPQELSDDLNGDGKVNIFDLLALLREMGQLRGSGGQEFKAFAQIHGHLLCEPTVRVLNWFDENGEVRGEYRIASNRSIQRIELVFDGDTLTETTGITPVLMRVDPDTIGLDLSDLFAHSEPKNWELKVWDEIGNCYADSGSSRFSFLKTVVCDLGGSPNTGFPIEFPLVLHGPWQRFGLVHPLTMGMLNERPLPVDLNREGADSLFFENLDPLSEAIMEEISANCPFWELDSMRESGPFASSAVSIQTGEKTDRLLFELSYFATGGYIAVSPLDGNEKLMSALGFPRWVRKTHAINNNYKLDPEIFEKYKDRNSCP